MSVLLSSNAPHICRDEFDKEALEFLDKYYPEALQRPVAVPILYVARHRMGLRVVEKRLTEDFSVLGQMCFTSGLTEIYDKEDGSYKMVKARYGTMIIDPDTIAKRNEGCRNNTIAHEAFHWHKHRDYHISISVVDPKKSARIRSVYNEYDESNKANWSDEDWMEWQARGIAPRILMPPEQFDETANRFFEENSRKVSSHGTWYIHTAVVNSLADFFQVSKQSVEIRLSERGYYLRE
jgi:Domain of unknown function (DUF955).